MLFIQLPSYPYRAVLSVFEQRLQPADLPRSFAEPLEQVAAFVKILLTGRRGTSDEIVGTNIQSGRQTTSDGQPEIGDFWCASKTCGLANGVNGGILSLVQIDCVRELCSLPFTAKRSRWPRYF